MSNKSFSDLDLDSDFSTRGPFGDFQRDEDPKEVGRRRLDNAAIIEIDRIIAKDQVREEFSEEDHNKLVATLKTQGQLQPIHVRWSDEDQRYIVMMGERRFRAAKDAGLTELECTIETKNLTTGQIIERQIIENTHRKQLNAVEEGKAYKQLMDLRECTAKDLAADIGVSPNTVQRAVRLLTLPEDILAEVASGQVPKTVIRELQSLKGANAEEQQRQLIADYKKSGSLREVEGKVKAKKGKAPSLTKKSFTSGGVKLQATGKKITNAQTIEALEAWLEQLKADGRGKKLEEGPIAGHVAA